MSGFCSAHARHDPDCKVCRVDTGPHPPRTKEEKLAYLQDWSFVSTDQFEIPGRGVIHTVACPIDCHGFGWLLYRNVEINKQPYFVKGVEAWAKADYRRFGDPIGSWWVRRFRRSFKREMQELPRRHGAHCSRRGFSVPSLPRLQDPL